MKIAGTLRSIKAILLTFGLVSFFGAGCSGSQQEEEKMEPTEEKEEEPKEEEKPEAEPEAVEEVQEEAAVTEPAPEPVAAIPAPVSNPNSAADKNRVVRYVNSDEAQVHGQPDDKAQAVGTLKKGDMILVIENGGWGKISDTMFIKLDTLSKKAVPRNRTPAVWGKPAH